MKISPRNQAALSGLSKTLKHEFELFTDFIFGLRQIDVFMIACVIGTFLLFFTFDDINGTKNGMLGMTCCILATSLLPAVFLRERNLPAVRQWIKDFCFACCFYLSHPCSIKILLVETRDVLAKKADAQMEMNAEIRSLTKKVDDLPRRKSRNAL